MPLELPHDPLRPVEIQFIRDPHLALGVHIALRPALGRKQMTAGTGRHDRSLDAVPSQRASQDLRQGLVLGDVNEDGWHRQ
jgi:hypothetical protein